MGVSTRVDEHRLWVLSLGRLEVGMLIVLILIIEMVVIVAILVIVVSNNIGSNSCNTIARVGFKFEGPPTDYRVL